MRNLDIILKLAFAVMALALHALVAIVFGASHVLERVARWLLRHVDAAAGFNSLPYQGDGNER